MNYFWVFSLFAVTNRADFESSLKVRSLWNCNSSQWTRTIFTFTVMIHHNLQPKVFFLYIFVLSNDVFGYLLLLLCIFIDVQTVGQGNNFLHKVQKILAKSDFSGTEWTIWTGESYSI